MPFSQLKLSAPILKAISDEGYDKPSPIQAQAIIPILEGRDVMAAAQTGTGKTAAFTWPMLEKLSKGSPAKPNQVRALIITPTRELAAQVGANVATYGKYMDLRYSVVFGGVKINPQMMALRKGVDILVATPGRLLDLYQQNAVKFNQLEILVLDEADRMLDMGFINDIKKILSLLPKQRQNLMFSATFSDDIRNLAKGLVSNPIEISVSPRNTTVESVSQYLVPVDKKQKTALLIHLLNEQRWQQVLVFTRTKHGANKLTRDLEKEKISTAAIHGNKSQGARTKALADFKNNKLQVLVATDIAARGIDIDHLPYVVNFDLPNVPEDYVHRIGRTGRAGATGQAVSLVSADESKQLSDIERLIKQLIPRKLIDGFEPGHDLPASRLNTQPARANKPKTPGSSRQNSARQSQGKQGYARQGQEKHEQSNKPVDRNKNRSFDRSKNSSAQKPTGNSASTKTVVRSSSSRNTSSRNPASRDSGSRDSASRDSSSKNFSSTNTTSKNTSPRSEPSKKHSGNKQPSGNTSTRNKTSDNASTAKPSGFKRFFKR